MDPEAYGALAHSLAEFGSVLDRLSEVTCPTTVLVGELDQPFREPSVAMSDAIPGSRLVVIPDAGHCPQEGPQEVWLGEVGPHLVWAAEP
jgi:pimeloyl-ACP methyl ester carboxylesterase